MVSIIILNWNGWVDTIECLKSIQKTEGVEYSVVVVDNGSSDDSVEQIRKYLSEQNKSFFVINEGERLITDIKKEDVILYCLRENYGFAKGNNLGVKLLKSETVDYFWILNNDTIVEKDSLYKLHFFMESHKQYAVCTPQIRYYSPQNRIWNCGGRMFFGFRKYFYEGSDDMVFNKDFFNISFVTGCAMFIRSGLLNDNCDLFSEKFFFGEEDFEFSLRLKKQKRKMACCTRSIIYHKVSASIKKKPKLSGIYIHYLNRYIDIRQHFSPSQYYIWKLINNMNLRRVLSNNGYDSGVVKSFIQKLNKESALYEGVTKELFESIMLMKK